MKTFLTKDFISRGFWQVGAIAFFGVLGYSTRSPKPTPISNSKQLLIQTNVTRRTNYERVLKLNVEHGSLTPIVLYEYGAGRETERFFAHPKIIAERGVPNSVMTNELCTDKDGHSCW